MEPLTGVLLAAYVHASAMLVGLALVRRLRACLTATEQALMGWTSGLGALSIALAVVGMAGAFRPIIVLLLPGVLAGAAVLRAGGGWSVVALATPARGAATRSLLWWTPLFALGGLVVLSGLAPPSDYDGLLYHLVAPRAYLEAGGFVYLPHNFSANLPMFGEALF